MEKHKYHLCFKVTQPQLSVFPEPKNQFDAVCHSSDTDPSAEVIIIFEHSMAVGWGIYQQYWERAAFTTTTKPTLQSLKFLMSINTYY